MRRIGLGLVILLSIGIAAYAFLFQAGVAGAPDFQARFGRVPLFAAFHVLGSGVALLLGGFQFVARIRSARIVLHRWLGRIYLVAVLIGGIGGAVLAVRADGGLVARLGFFLLAVVWLVSGWQAYAAVRRGDIATHRLWMTRNFALTFAAVTLRVYLGIMTGPLGLDFADAYQAVAWLCWVPNLIIAEWLLVRRADYSRSAAASGLNAR
ncbi:MAG: DUF2306 domain-containing protein [Gammaproteobacteria bacterium]